MESVGEKIKATFESQNLICKTIKRERHMTRQKNLFIDIFDLINNCQYAMQ